MDRTQKEILVAELHETFKAAKLVVVTTQSGMTVGEVSDLRNQMRVVGASYKVTKNSLAQLALKGTDFEHLADHFTGPTAIAYSEDAVAAAKAVITYGKTNEKIKVVAGAMGSQGLDADSVKALASLPSLDELRGKLVGLLQAPGTKVAGILQAPAGQLARVFGAYASQG